MSDLPLGKPTRYPTSPDAALLCRLARRAPDRPAQRLAADGLMVGVDEWHLFELAWLSPNGIPRVGLGCMRCSARSPYLVESKSMKLYLNGFFRTRFPSAGAFADRVRADLTSLLEDPSLEVVIDEPSTWERWMPASPTAIPSLLEDTVAAEGGELEPVSAVRVKASEQVVEERLFTHAVRSLCPVTGQPDWGSAEIHYRGRAVEQRSLLGWILQHRESTGFHEQVTEDLFCELVRALSPTMLAVRCTFTRRGGISISPLRTTAGYQSASSWLRSIRQ